MNKDLHDIDNLFKQSVDGHLEEVPPEVWQNIDHGLDKKQAAFYKRKYFTVRAAAILLLLIGGVTIAAILRYHSTEGFTSKEVVAAKPKHYDLKTTKQGSQNPTVQKVQEPQETTAEEQLPTAKTPGKTPVGENESGQIQSTENSAYAAEKGHDVATQTRKTKRYQQKHDATGKSISPEPIYEVVQEAKKVQQVRTETATKATEQLIEDKQIRTSYITARAMDVSAFQVDNSIRARPLATSVMADVNATVISPIAERSKNSLGSWSVSSMYAQNMDLNRLEDDDRFGDPRNNSREAKRTEQETKSYSIGVGVQRKLAGSFGIQTGLQYFSSQTTIEPKMIFAERDWQGEVRYRFNCSSGDSYIPSKYGAAPMVGDSIRTSSSESSLSYLQVPLLVSYRICFGKFSILPCAGFQTNFLLNSKLSSSLVQASGDEDVSSPIEGLRSMYFGGVLQPQFNYRFTDRISFDLSPNINFSLTPINKETAVKTYQNMFSVGAGLRIKL